MNQLMPFVVESIDILIFTMWHDNNMKHHYYVGGYLLVLVMMQAEFCALNLRHIIRIIED